jgi:hypothetical protein
MNGQLGQVTLDVAEGEALAGLLGDVEDVAGNQLDGFDHAHGEDCRRLWPRCGRTRVARRQVSQLRGQEVAHRDGANCDVTPKCPVAQL